MDVELELRFSGAGGDDLAEIRQWLVDEQIPGLRGIEPARIPPDQAAGGPGRPAVLSVVLAPEAAVPLVRALREAVVDFKPEVTATVVRKGQEQPALRIDAHSPPKEEDLPQLVEKLLAGQK